MRPETKIENKSFPYEIHYTVVWARTDCDNLSDSSETQTARKIKELVYVLRIINGPWNAGLGSDRN